MKKSFMTRVLAVTLSTAMAFSVSSAGNLMTASAAGSKPFVALKTKFKTLSVGEKYKMTLKNNSLKWRIQSATSSDKKIVNPYKVKSTYVKLKAKAEGRVKVTYKLKTAQRKTNNTKTLKGTVKVKASGSSDSNNPSTTTFGISATASDTANVKVTFTQAIDTEGVGPDNFSVNKDVEVRDAKVSEDGKTVDLTIAGATYSTEYEVTVTGVKVNGEAKDAVKATFKTPGQAEDYQLSLLVPDKPMKSNGQTSAVIKFELRDPEGNLVTTGAEVEFSASKGKFASARAVLDNGVAQDTYTAPASDITTTDTITATITSADDKDLVGRYEVANITAMPNPGDTDTSVGAIITNVIAPTADRVIAYFQSEVPVQAKDFKTESGALDKKKFAAEVRSGLDGGLQGGRTVDVVGVLDVEGENALQLLVDEPMIDNSTVSVSFQDKRNTNSVINSSNIVYCKLTDGVVPSLLRVDVLNNRTLEVVFDEAMLRTRDAQRDGGTNVDYAADLASNYAIDAEALNFGRNTGVDGDDEENTINVNSSKNRSDNQIGTGGTVSVGTYRNGVDKRHIVTIQLQEGRALSAGQHSLSVSNVGDWAAHTDGWRNIITTSTVDFMVEDNQQKPTLELVEIMSPEQFKLKANCDFTIVNPDTTFRTTRSNRTDKTTLVQLQERRNGQWVTISNDPNDGITAAQISQSTNVGTNPIMVSQIRDKDNWNTDEFLVETMKDWTVVCDTLNTKNNYHLNDYQLYIPAGVIRNTANALTNDAITIPLTDDSGKMKTWDTTSPEMETLEQATDEDGKLTKSYNVTFTEPVKMNMSANREGMTPKQEVLGRVWQSEYTAMFTHADTREQIPASIVDSDFIDAEDKTIRIQPSSDLYGGTWQVSVTGLIDDVGNSVSTRTFDIVVEEDAVTTDFKVLWAAVADQNDYKRITTGEGGFIFVKFNQPIRLYGGSTNAGASINYTLNGNPLPSGVNIRAHINNYDDHRTDVIDSITIELPKRSTTQTGLGANTIDYLVSGQHAVLGISNEVTDINGTRLSGDSSYTLPYHYAKAGEGWSLYTTAGDAVWGNDPTEKWAGNVADPQAASYIAALKEALADDQYREVILDKNLADATDGMVDTRIPLAYRTIGCLMTDLDIDRIVSLDLNGCSIYGNIKIHSNVASDGIKITNGQKAFGKDSVIKGRTAGAALTINTPYTSVTWDGIDIQAPVNGVDVYGNVVESYAADIQAMWRDTLNIRGNVRLLASNGTIGGGTLAITGDNIGLNNESTQIGTIKIDTTGTVYLKGNYPNNCDINLTKAADLVLTSAATFGSGVKIYAKADGAKVSIDDGADDSIAQVTVVAEAQKVEIKFNGSTEIKLQNAGGSFVQKDLSGKDKAESEAVSDITVGGLQAWLGTLHFVGDSQNDKDVEYVTASAATAGALLNGGKSIGSTITSYSSNDYVPESDSENRNWSITSISVTLDSNASYLSYDSVNNTVAVKADAENIKNAVKNKFTVNIRVTKGGNTKTLTKTVEVTIQPKQS